MNTIVLIKQVPDTTEVKLDPKTGNMIREGIESVINPDDRHALEMALAVKDRAGGKVTAVSMGPPQAVDALSEALGMGADEGILLSDMAFAGSDTWATSLVLGKAIEKKGGFDLVLCGRQAIDGDTAQIGPQVADHLGIPQAAYVFGIEEIGEKSVVVKRRLEDGYEVLECRLPALLTVIDQAGRPRHPDVKGLIASCREKAPLKVWNAADIGVLTSEVGLEGSLTHVVRTFAPKFERRGEKIGGKPAEAAGVLMEKLYEHKLL
ncbi:Electron transfer flavoprotein subunit beta [Candidatus Desulfarcum epimagneticum]|uniref:Protein FixA n=1 Tax=uncultured Desulfobacteraceae bacterium TaxID=218296 RepID=A0A484HH09_9BACT|nr:Electron transfer flavoprotein subunit beta [uncultured Desulfobacteraceae bacterium]